MCYEQKEIRHGVMGAEQALGSSDEDETRAEGAARNVNNGPRAEIQVHDGLEMPLQQSQNSVIRWERFLPIRSLKVLLVENDDSTRHVVGALLQNCSYEVTAVANGLQAWKILEDLNNHIDLVLTEVVMPILSGIGLLCKIMSHKTFKNIPVIMMSSHDSMGIVFKCLSKGAVDFLVKPIRKNELKNLWQHVWRRCHSSSGSGSESGTQSEESAKLKSNEDSENNSDSSDELDDNGSNGLSNRDGSDNGSGTQSSWTKRAAGDSRLPISASYQLADAPDSTCAQLIHTKPETFGNRWIHVTETKECHEKDEQHDDVAMGKDLEIGVSWNPDIRVLQCENLSSLSTSKRQIKLSESDGKKHDNGLLEHNSENMGNKLGDQPPKTTSTNANCINSHAESKKIDASNGPSVISQLKDEACCGSGELPSLELTLKRQIGVGDSGNASNDDRNVLRHSDLSAFSKYNTASSANQGLTGNVGSCSPLNNSSVAMKTETPHNIAYHLRGTLLNQQSNGSCNNNDMASTAKNVTPKPETFNDKSESTSAFKSIPSSAFHPVQNGHTCSPRPVTPGNVEDARLSPDQPKFRGSHQQVHVQHHHHHHHHYHHHVHRMQQHQSQLDHDDISLKNMAAAALQCGSSNVVGGASEGNTGNCSINGSASGSDHGSNGQHRSSNPFNAGVTNIESDNRTAVNSGAGGNSVRTNVDEDRVAQRVAALSKFRQKRKERCFEKRVRYQSRKRLAERRPRFKGQFVRQIVYDNTNQSDTKAGGDCQSNDLTSEDNSCDSVR